MSKRKARSGRGLMMLGLLLMAAALGLSIYNIREADAAGREAQVTLKKVESLTVETVQSVPADPAEIADHLLYPEMEMPRETVEGEEYLGTLEIPALGLKLPVMAEWSYPRLKKAPCRYSGSVYTDDMVLAGHNYKTHFGGLKRLSIDDEIRFTDVEGNLFRYRVMDLETLDGTAVEEMEQGNPGLTLFTCTLGGRSRLAVRAERVEGNE